MRRILENTLYFKVWLRALFTARALFLWSVLHLFCLRVANTNPIFSLTPVVSWGAALLTAANTAYDGTGTVTTVYTAGTNGSFVSKVRFKLGSTAGTSAATVARIFINNGSTNATAGNNILWEEVSLPAIAQTQTAATPTYDVPMNIALPNGYKINVTLGTAPGGSTGWYCSCAGGDY